MWDAIDVNCEAIVEDNVLAGIRVVDVGCETVDGDVAHDAVMTSSPSTATPTSPLICSSILTASALFFAFPGSFASVLEVKAEGCNPGGAGITLSFRDDVELSLSTMGLAFGGMDCGGSLCTLSSGKRTSIGNVAPTTLSPPTIQRGHG